MKWTDGRPLFLTGGLDLLRALPYHFCQLAGSELLKLPPRLIGVLVRHIFCCGLVVREVVLFTIIWCSTF
jgi:hypothetical protein